MHDLYQQYGVNKYGIAQFMAEKVIFNAIDPVFLERIVPLMPDKIDHNSEVFGLHKYFFGFESLFES